jgi:antirestriction protein ArdC/superfamily I DNA/RNA helicase
MGMVSFNKELPIDDVVGPNGETNLDFVFDDPEEEPKTLKPSAQQKAIVAAVASGKDVIVQALAGTGKTTTLKMAARAVAEKNPDKTILYIAFNRKVAADINQDPDRPSNLIARTDSQVAWHHSPAWLQQRGFNKTLISRNLDVAKYLGTKPITVRLISKDGIKVDVELSTLEAFDFVKKAVIQFSQSSDEKVMPKHFDEKLDNVPASFLDQANAWWDDISNPEGELAVNRSFFSKYVELNGIDLKKPSLFDSDQKIPKTDIIFFDEAQDINDVTASWVRSQKMQKVFVGDGNQSIYMFRGSKNQLETLEGAETLQLTESYRFGPNIAGIANRFLAFNGKTEKVIGLSKDQGELVDAADMPDPDAVLVRTNGGALEAMQDYLDQGKTVGISQSLKTRVEEALDTIGWLNAGKPKDGKPDNYNPEIGNYDSFEELTTEVMAGRAPGIKSLYDLYVRTGAERIREILGRVIVQEEDTEESKSAKSTYSPITIDQAEDGSSGKLSDDVSYKIVGDSIVLDVKFVRNEYYRKLLMENLRKAGMPARKTGKKIKNYKGELVDEWTRDASIPDDLDRTDKLNKIKKTLNGIVDSVVPDVAITTGHISKGDEWDNVLVYKDFEFFGPRPDKQDLGRKIMPDEQEVNLAYVVVTRAKKRIALGPLNWVYEYTKDSDEQASEEISNLNAMANIPTDPVPVTPEELDSEILETAKKVNPATQKIADAIIAALESGTAPWRKPWTGGGFLPTKVSDGTSYRGSNLLVLWAAQEKNGWTDNRWLTFREANIRGGSIIKGEKATKVIYWPEKYKDVEQPDGTMEKVRIFLPPKIYDVFNLDQTTGVNLPPLVKRDPIPVSQAEQTLLDTYKDRPEIFYKSQDSAYYSPVTDTIHLPLREQFGAEQDLFETLVHELAHSTGHSSRVNRTELLDNYGTHKASRGEEELIAEISVAIVAARLGVEIDFGNVASYAKSWLSAVKNDPDMIIKAAQQAQKAVDHMLGKETVPEDLDEDGNPVQPVGEGVGSEGKTGDQIAEDAGLKPEPTPEGGTGVASIKGEYQKGTPNSGQFKDGMNYEIQMDERKLDSGQTTGGTYGVRKLVVSGNTFKNKEELKAAGFRYDGASKTWSKSYLRKVFNVETLTQDVLDKNPDPEITEDLLKFLEPEIAPTSGTTKGYAGFHSAPTRETGSPLHDVTANGIYPEDVYSTRGEQIYGTGHREGLDPKAHKMILSMRGKPNAVVKIYRSIPSDAEGEINPGDWVTPFKAYAEEHGESNLNNDYKIVTSVVKASDLFTEGNSWLEWGYDPATTPEPNVGEQGTSGEEIAGEAPTTPESIPEPNVGEQGRTGEEIASEDDIKSAGTEGGHDLSPREVYNNNLGRSDRDIKKVYNAESIWAPMSNPIKYPVAPKREDFQDRDSYLAAYKKYAKDYDDAYRESTKYIKSPIGEKNLNGSQKGVQNYVKDVITADWFVEAFGDGKRIGRPPVTLFTSKKEGGRYSYGFKNGVFISTLKINKLLSKNEPNILHEIAHFATLLSVGDGFDGHGVEFRMNYIYIINKVLGREAAEGLKEAYRKDNLDVG